MDPCRIQPQANATFPSSMAWLDDRRLAFKLRDSHDWSQGTDGAPETVLNFKFCRQATNKVAGISGDVAAFLDDLF